MPATTLPSGAATRYQSGSKKPRPTEVSNIQGLTASGRSVKQKYHLHRWRFSALGKLSLSLSLEGVFKFRVQLYTLCASNTSA